MLARSSRASTGFMRKGLRRKSGRTALGAWAVAKTKGTDCIESCSAHRQASPSRSLMSKTAASAASHLPQADEGPRRRPDRPHHLCALLGQYLRQVISQECLVLDDENGPSGQRGLGPSHDRSPRNRQDTPYTPLLERVTRS